MKISRNVVALAAVAGAAFAAGHLFALRGEGGEAWAAQDDKQSEAMQACIEAGTPGEHHQYLDQLVGEWTGEYRIWMEPGTEPMVFNGTVSREWVLGNRFLRETVECTSPMGPFNAIGFSGYDNVDGQYEFAWLDSMSTGIYFETGTYDPKRKVLSSRGSNRDPATGRVIPSWGDLDLSNPDRHVFVGHSVSAAGGQFKHFEGVLQRRK